MFLPHPEAMEEIGRTWVQEFDVTGTVQASQGSGLVVGKIGSGRAVAVYTPTGFDTVETPLGPREALRIEQELDLELNIDFDLGGQLIPATEVANLTTVYWIAKGIGPVRIHWGGGTIEYDVELDETSVKQQTTVPALAEDQLVIVCISVEAQSSECMRTAGVSESDLTAPPESELEVQGFVFPDGASSDSSSVAAPGAHEPTQEPGQTSDKPVATGTPERPTQGDDGRFALLEYAAEVERLGRQTSDIAEEFVESAMKYRNGEITLEEFQREFLEFAPKVREVIREVNQLHPSSEAEAVHKQLTDGLAKCDQAVDLMDEWFDSQDSGTKEATVLLVAECVGEVETAGDELSVLTAD
jgi:hypothetical protein